MQQWDKTLQIDEQLLRRKLTDRVGTLTAGEARVTLNLIDQLIVCFDPEIVQDFAQWRNDPRLASVLQLVAKLDDEQRDQVLFFVEDLFASEKAANEDKTG